MNQKQKSKEAELRFAAEFTRKGYTIFMPAAEDGPVDLVIYKDNKFQRVQVKATKHKKGTLTVKLRSTNNWQNKIYTTKDIDLIAVYDHENKNGYLFKLKDFEGAQEVNLRHIPTKNNQVKKVNSAEKYLFFK